MDIVFDLGGVVIEWDPVRFVATQYDDASLGVRVLEHLVYHPDWLELDRGTLSVPEAIERAAARSGLAPEVLGRFFAALPDLLVPIPASVELTRRLKRAGHRLFILSNMASATINHLEASYPIWDVFEGAVISSRVHLVKPEPAIYEHLIRTFGLGARATLFIDDLERNLVAARAVGLRTLRFASAAECSEDLRALGYLP
jgi:putative hydrolase of the HAD superfamily